MSDLTPETLAELRRLADYIRECVECDAVGRDDDYDPNERLVKQMTLGRLAADALPALLDAATELAHMTEARDNARAEVERLTALVEAVRALHYQASFCSCGDCDGGGFCGECGGDFYPCPTIRALDEEDDRD